MNAKRVESLVWVLIYGGLLLVALGWFVGAGSAVLGWALAGVGGVAAAAGAVLIVVRSRMNGR
jgi:hypothetical protein